MTLILSAALQLVAFRDIWLPESYEVDQFHPGYFEAADDGVVVTVGDRIQTYMLPGVSLDDDGALRVPPGRLLIVPLRPSSTYRLRNFDSDTPPYGVLGRYAPLRASRGRSGLTCSRGSPSGSTSGPTSCPRPTRPT